MSRINQQHITSNKIRITMVHTRETYNILLTQISPQKLNQSDFYLSSFPPPPLRPFWAPKTNFRRNHPSLLKSVLKIFLDHPANVVLLISKRIDWLIFVWWGKTRAYSPSKVLWAKPWGFSFSGTLAFWRTLTGIRAAQRLDTE